MVSNEKKNLHFTNNAREGLLNTDISSALMAFEQGVGGAL